MTVTPRFLVVNPWVAALAIFAQAALFAVLLWSLRGANEAAFAMTRRAAASDTERSECMSAIRLDRYRATECELWRESLTSKLERMAQACAVFP